MTGLISLELLDKARDDYAFPMENDFLFPKFLHC